MDYNEVLTKARTNIGPYCKACPVCNGKGLRQLHARPGSKTPATAQPETMTPGSAVFVNMDTICSHEAPDTRFELFAASSTCPYSPPP